MQFALDKFALLISCVSLIAVAWFFWQYQLDQERLRALEQRQPVRSHMETLDLQKRCADQAAKVFRDKGLADQEQDKINTFKSHYDPKLQRCFIQIDMEDYSKLLSDDVFSVMSTLTDAFEGAEYGNFFLSRHTDRPLPDVVSCRMRPVGEAAKECSTREEWNAFTIRHMR